MEVNRLKDRQWNGFRQRAEREDDEHENGGWGRMVNGLND